jgi:hypothetical protein
LMIALAKSDLELVAGVVLIISCIFAAISGWRASMPAFKSGERVRSLSWKANAIRGAVYVPASVTILLVVANFSFKNSWPFVEIVLAASFWSFSMFSLPAFFWFGGIDLVMHGTLRLVLALTGTMPLRLRRFLDYAVHLGFLQRAGGGYIFFHRLLLEHFAALHTRDGGSATEPPGVLTLPSASGAI